jgi:hypothetical protein
MHPAAIGAYGNGNDLGVSLRNKQSMQLAASGSFVK